MKCAKCGAEIQDGAKFCENCGAPIAAPEVAAAAAAATATVTEAVNEAPEKIVYETPETPKAPEAPAQAPAQAVNYAAPAPSQKKNVWSLILGIAGLSSCWLGWLGLFGIISIAICIVGLVIGGKAKKEPQANKMCKVGWILSLIGLILAALFTIIGTIIWGAAFRYYI